MKVSRLPLAGSATICYCPEEGLLLLDDKLDRAEAALAIQGVAPRHPDVVDHLLDQVYERPRRWLAKMVVAVVLLAGSGSAVWQAAAAQERAQHPTSQVTTPVRRARTPVA